MQVFDGDSVSANELTNKLWGYSLPSPVTSSGPTMLTHFHAYYSVTDKQGFTASYRATVKEHTGKKNSYSHSTKDGTDTTVIKVTEMDRSSVSARIQSNPLIHVYAHT